jgi:DNA-binding transcriptional ArsR family regulator
VKRSTAAPPRSRREARRPKHLAALDLNALGAQIKATAEKAKADDPKELRRRLAELERQVAAKPQTERVEVKVPVLENGQLEAALGLVGAMREMAQDLLGRADTLSRTISAATSPRPAAASAKAPPIIPNRILEAPSKPAQKVRESVHAAAPAGDLTGPQQAILDTVLMLEARGVPASRDAVARWLGIHPNGGSFGANLGRLRSDGYLDGFTLTDRGRAAARTQATGFDSALAALDEEPKRRILRTLVELGRPVSRDELAEALGPAPERGQLRGEPRLAADDGAHHRPRTDRADGRAVPIGIPAASLHSHRSRLSWGIRSTERPACLPLPW